MSDLTPSDIFGVKSGSKTKTGTVSKPLKNKTKGLAKEGRRFLNPVTGKNYELWDHLGQLLGLAAFFWTVWTAWT